MKMSKILKHCIMSMLIFASEEVKAAGVEYLEPTEFLPASIMKSNSLNNC
jgi:hypothetical protein